MSCAAMDSINPLKGVVPAEYHDVMFKSGMIALSHPFEYAKVLIQIGHEPIAPRRALTFTGHPALQLPSVFQYVGHIRKRDGFLGLYRGCAPRIVGAGVSSFVSDRLKKTWSARSCCGGGGGKTTSRQAEDEECDSPEELVDATARQAVETVACMVVSHPFHVCAVRAMAQFIGREEKYDGVFGALIAIYREDGILGYWAGFVPRVIGELTALGLTAAATYVINKYVVTDKAVNVWTKRFVSYFASSFCYPFNVVANCMVVSHSGLAASYPPHMPLYRNWVDCWRHLSSQKQLKRGSSLFIRYYSGPQVVVGDRVLPINRSFCGI